MNDEGIAVQGSPPAASGAGRGARGARAIAAAAALAALPVGAVAAYWTWQATTSPDALPARPAALGADPLDAAAESMRKVDPALISHRQLAPIDVGIDSPRAIAVDPATGDLLVAAPNLVRRLSASGQLLKDLAVEGTPHALAADADGTLFVAFKDHVEVFGRDGKRRATWASYGGGAYITGLAIAGDAVYVADAGRKVVVAADRDGTVLREIGRRDEARGVPGLVVPSAHLDVAVSDDGTVWIANPGRHRLEAYTPDGALARSWGEAGIAVGAFHGCCNPADFLLLADGSFITAEKGVPRVKRYDSTGKLTGVLIEPTQLGEGTRGMDLAAGPDGRVYLLERSGSRHVRVLVPKEPPGGANGGVR